MAPRRPTQVVFDTNTLVSAFIGSDRDPRPSPTRALWAVIDAPNIEMVVSPALLDELEDVLRRDWMRRYIPLDHVPDAMRVIVTNARLEKDVPNPPRRVKDDPDDDYIVALAVSTRSTLVTGDGGVRKLRPEGYDVMTIAELLAAIEGGS